MRNFTMCFLAVFLCFNTMAQTHQQLAKTTIPLSRIERVTLPKVNNKLLKEKELKERALTKARAIQFAEPIEVSITPQTHGTWENLKNGYAVWKLKVYSPNALSLNLGFHQFFLPKNSRFFIYSPDYKKVLGPFTANDNELHKQLWTPIIEGDEVVLELQIDSEQIPHLALELGTVNHDFMGFGQKLLSGSCNLDVICGTPDGWPRVDDYRDIIRSAAVYSVGGTLACSGALINNARNDCTPYFLTADHCGVRTGNAPSVVVYWNFENSTCRQPNTPQSGAFGDGTLDDFNSGSTFRATYGASDFTLIELDDPVSETAEPYFAGWDRENHLPDGAICIHHPNTDEKRISFENNPCTLSNFGGSMPNTHVMVNDWDTGTTEPGSSGSPLFNLNKQIVGQLSGGGAACGNNESDEFGWVKVSWEGGGSPQSRLKDWLDPDGIGVLNLNGKDCSYGLTLSQSFVEVCNQNIDSFAFDLTLTDNFLGSVGVYLEVIPQGLEVNYSANPIPTGGTTMVNLSNLSTLAAGTYSLEFFATDEFDTGTTVFTFTIVEDLPTTPMLANPANDQTEVLTNPTYEWNLIDDATYSIEVALDENFAEVVIGADNLNNETFVGTTLDTETTYYWHIKATNVCGEGEWSETFRFTTADIRCTVLQASDLPISIPGFPPTTITSKLEVNELGTIAGIEVVNLRGTHSYIGDLEFVLVSPAGTEVTLISGQCGEASDFDINFSDQAAASPPCPYTDGNAYRPANPLSAFNGESPIGIWTLRVRDSFPGDGGSLNNWGLQICTAPDFGLLASAGVTACVNAPFEIPITVGGAFEDSGVTMNINGLPDETELSFSENPATPGSTVTAIISNITAIGVYALTISASDGMHNSFTQTSLTVLPPVAASPTPTSPETESIVAGLNVNFNWSILGGITGYHLEVATDETFTDILVSEITPSIGYKASNLDGNTVYYWRISGVNVCGDGPWSETFNFRTPQLICNQGTSDEIVEIGSDEPDVYTSTITIAEDGLITDVNVSDIIGLHTFVGDLTFTLISPAGTEVILLSQECEGAQNFNISFDNDAETNISCPINLGNTHRPNESLDLFKGEDAKGLWTLQVEDGGFFDGGQLQSWKLQVCTEPDFSLTSLPEIITACPNQTATFSLNVGDAFDATAGVSLTAEELPLGTTANFSEPNTSPGATVEVTVEGLTVVGDYTFVFTATDGTETTTTEVNITILGEVTGVTLLAGPINGTNLDLLTTNLAWVDIEGINAYEVELSTTADFSTTALLETVNDATNFDTPLLDGNTTYYWHVRGVNDCGAGAWSDAFRFTTPNIVCSQTEGLEMPVVIDAATQQDYNNTINVVTEGIVKDVNISLNGTHSYIGDLIFTLISPTGTELVLVNQLCTESETFSITFDDEADLAIPCPYDDGGSYLPENALSTFNGESASGIWTLRVRDNAEADGGSLDNWNLAVCVEPQEVLMPVASFTVGIDGLDVFVSDKSDNAESWLWDFGDGTTFEGQNPPIHTYTDGGEYTICLTVTNLAGENTTCETVNIIVGIDPILTNNLIRFYPNPTNDLLYIDFDTSLQMEVTLQVFGVNGQQILQRELTTAETTSTAMVDLSNVATGVYFVRLTSNDWTVAKKVVKD
ncbi:MAG: proprotein convertase P-domain-containing protein [Chitinophagales bacterium]